MNILDKGAAVRSVIETNGRLDVILENSERAKFKIRLWRGEGVANLPDPEWLLRNFVQRGGLTVVYGPPASGKSLLMLDMAQHVQMGAQWLGKHAAHQANALYVMAEGQFGLKGRLEAWKVQNKEETLPPVNYHIEGVSFWTPNERENPGAESIVMAAAAMDVGVVFIDTMAATFGGGDENRQQDMNIWLRPLRELRQMGVSVVVAHHVAKGSSTLRGSTVLGGDADTLIELRPTMSKDNPGVVEYVTVINQKQKDYVPFVPFRMNLHSVELAPLGDGRERSGPVLVLAQSDYEGVTAQNGRRLTKSTRRAAMREMMIEIVTDEPGLSWRKLRGMMTGTNTEKALIRDELIEARLLEYDEGLGGYILGPVELEYSGLAEIPPLLGESEEE